MNHYGLHDSLIPLSALRDHVERAPSTTTVHKATWESMPHARGPAVTHPDPERAKRRWALRDLLAANDGGLTTREIHAALPEYVNRDPHTLHGDLKSIGAEPTGRGRGAVWVLRKAR